MQTSVQNNVRKRLLIIITQTRLKMHIFRRIIFLKIAYHYKTRRFLVLQCTRYFKIIIFSRNKFEIRPDSKMLRTFYIQKWIPIPIGKLKQYFLFEYYLNVYVYFLSHRNTIIITYIIYECFFYRKLSFYMIINSIYSIILFHI